MTGASGTGEPDINASGPLWIAAMQRGDWDSAFAVNDAVLAARDPGTRDDPGLPYHQRWVWDGTDPAGRDVVVRCYHGLGDTIQFARYLPALAARARRVTVEMQPELIPLFAGLPVRLLPFDPAAPIPAADSAIEIMELAHALRLPPDTVALPELRVPAEAVAQARTRYGRGALGLCWGAGDWDGERSVPLEKLARALAPDARLVSLQRGPAAAQAGLPGAPGFLNPDDTSMSIARTAATILALDGVVCVDTMVAHLAGTLGRRTIVLLKHDADWRWMADRADSPWYPAATLIRQERPRDWGSAVETLRAALSRPGTDLKH